MLRPLLIINKCSTLNIKLLIYKALQKTDLGVWTSILWRAEKNLTLIDFKRSKIYHSTTICHISLIELFIMTSIIEEEIRKHISSTPVAYPGIFNGGSKFFGCKKYTISDLHLKNFKFCKSMGVQTRPPLWVCPCSTHSSINDYKLILTLS